MTRAAASTPLVERSGAAQGWSRCFGCLPVPGCRRPGLVGRRPVRLGVGRGRSRRRGRRRRRRVVRGAAPRRPLLPESAVGVELSVAGGGDVAVGGVEAGSVWGQVPFGGGELAVGVGEVVFEVGDPLPVGGGGGPCGGEVVVDLALELVERRRDLAARCRLVRSSIRLGRGCGVGWWRGCRRGRWPGRVEEVAGGVGVVVVGDDEELVGVASAGGADVQAAAAGGGGDEFDADVDGVGLVAVFGGGVAELDVFGDVVGGQDGVTGAVSGGDVEVAVVDGGDGPQFAVADRFAGGGVDLAVVAAGDDDVAGVGVLSVSDRRGHGGVELTGGGAGGLDGVVDRVDVLVGGGGDGDRPAVLVGC